MMLTAANYSIWKPRMEDILYCKDLYDPVEKGDAKPESITSEDWKKMHRKAIGTIRQWVDISVFHHVATETNAQTLWRNLQNLYERKTAQNKAFTIRKLVNLKYKEGRSVAEHLSDFQDMVNRLTTMKLVLDEELQALLLLSSLPDSWETLVVSLSNSTSDGQLSLTQVKDSMFNEEARRKDLGTNSSQALVTENRGRSKSRGPSNKSRDRSKSGVRRKFKCFQCGEEGHIKRNCKYRKNRDQNNRRTMANDENTATPVTDGEVVLFTLSDEECHVADSCDEWVVDSAASYHATPNKEFFTSYKAGDFGKVRMGNSSNANIVGVGDVCIQTNVGCTLTLKDVRHVPDLRLNLISVHALDRAGCYSSFGDGKWKLSKGSMIIARGKVCNTLYKTQVKQVGEGLNAVEDDASPNLWHKRLAHMSEKGLQILARKSLIPYAKDTKLNPCDHCLFGKHHKVSFSKRLKRKKNILEMVHSDVCGPMEVETLGGSRYFVTFIDDASRKVWVYFLKTKDQVLQYFKRFHAMVERQTGKPLKCLRSDNGGEYTSHDFKNYCFEHGIRHEKTVPGTPQHNGVAERINRTIMERVRCMLRMAKLPKPFWGEAVQTACYLINRSPSVPLGFDIPERVWSGHDIKYSHLKVFGCKAFAHVSKEQRQKLDDRAIPCIFLGYGDEEFGYRLWDPEKKRVIRSRDVVFHEQETMSDSATQEKAKESGGNVDLTPVSPPRENATTGGELDDHGVEDEPATEEPATEDAEDEGGVEQGEPIPAPDLRRSDRLRFPSTKYPSSEFILLTEEGEPENIEEVQTHKDKIEWMKAMQEEMNSLQKNDTYDLVELPKGRKALKNKWVFKLKKDGDKLVKYKARLVVKGFGQKRGIDFDEIFSPVVKMSSIRVILGLTASLDLELEQLDVKTAFLHGDLEEEIYMDQPEGFEEAGKEHMVCRLKKSLYGLKQAPRQWYKKFDSFMMSHGYSRTDADHCVYVKTFPGGKFIILLLYVDDMLIVGQDAKMIGDLKKDLSKSFDMKNLGSAKQILGMQILRDRKAKKLWLSQEKYVERVLERFNMKSAKPVSTPLANHFKLSKRSCPTNEEGKKLMASIPYSSAVGSLMYAMVCTRPDIAHAVGVVSRYLSNPGKDHWEAVKWILRYLRGSSRMCLCFEGPETILEGYADADMAGDLDGRKSTSGYVFTFAGGAVSWQSKLQKCVALSTTEAEYIALTEAGKEMLWLKRFLQQLAIKQEGSVIHCDSQSALDLSKNAMYHPRTKHIDVRYHWLRQAVEDEEFKLEKIHTDRNPADMMTKFVARDKFQLCAELIGMDPR